DREGLLEGEVAQVHAASVHPHRVHALEISRRSHAELHVPSPEDREAETSILAGRPSAGRLAEDIDLRAGEAILAQESQARFPLPPRGPRAPRPPRPRAE